MFINPLLHDISSLKAQASSYDEALENSKALLNERDKLTKKFNSIAPEDKEKLSKLLPNNVDNIRLILEIEKIAGPYGMVLRDVQYNTAEEESKPGNNLVSPDLRTALAPQDYGSWDLEFSTQGTYANFLNFVKSLENNLRIVDISSIEFSSPASSSGQAASNIYRYSFKIKTYWLKD